MDFHSEGKEGIHENMADFLFSILKNKLKVINGILLR